MALVVFLLEHGAVFVLVASTALAAGLPPLRRLAMSAAERAALAAAVGLAIAGHVALGLGLVGLLRPGPVAACAVAAHAAAWRDLRALLAAARRPRHAVWLAAALSWLAVFLICALYPPLAFDETLYHLPFARAFAATHALPVLPDLRFPVFPALVEAVFAAIMLLAGDDTWSTSRPGVFSAIGTGRPASRAPCPSTRIPRCCWPRCDGSARTTCWCRSRAGARRASPEPRGRGSAGCTRTGRPTSTK